MPGKPHGFVENLGRGGIRAGLGECLGQAKQQCAPAGRRGLRRPPLDIKGLPEMTGSLFIGQRPQRVPPGPIAVRDGLGGGLGADGYGLQEVIGELGMTPSCPVLSSSALAILW
jgi:hypothetical protein